MPPPRPHRQPARRREVTLEPEDLGRPPEPAPSPSAGPGGCRAGDRTHTTHDPQIVYTLSCTPSMPGHPIYEHALLSTQEARRLAPAAACHAGRGRDVSSTPRSGPPDVASIPTGRCSTPTQSSGQPRRGSPAPLPARAEGDARHEPHTGCGALDPRASAGAARSAVAPAPPRDLRGHLPAPRPGPPGRGDPGRAPRRPSGRPPRPGRMGSPDRRGHGQPAGARAPPRGSKSPRRVKNEPRSTGPDRA